MERLSRRQPVLLIFEDVHWADPTSLELLELTIGRAQNVPVLVVLTYRPEFSPPWSGHTHVTSRTLNRFTRSLATAMVRSVTGGKLLPDKVLEQIIEKTDGVPLFVEELTKTILGSGLLAEESNRYVVAGPLQDVTIPATLHDSLMRVGALVERAFATWFLGFPDQSVSSSEEAIAYARELNYDSTLSWGLSVGGAWQAAYWRDTAAAERLATEVIELPEDQRKLSRWSCAQVSL